MSSTQNAYDSPISDAIGAEEKSGEFGTAFAVLSLLSILVPFVVGVCLEQLFGLMSGRQIMLLFSTSIGVTLILGIPVHNSWKLRIGWSVLLLFAYAAVAVFFAIGTVLFGGLEAT